MKHSTLLINIWRKALTTMVLCLVSAVAFAADFEPAPTTFNTTDLNGTYDVTFVGCELDEMFVEVVNVSDYTLVDASGAKVNYAFVAPEMKDNFTVTFTVANADNVPNGTYYIKVPAAAFCLSWMPNITSDAFDVTLNLNNGSEPDGPGTGEVDPEENHDGEIIFTLDDYKSDTSLYFHEGDVLESNGAGVLLKFGRVGIDYEQYTTCYQSNGFVQFKDCEFTISAPYGNNIRKIVFEDGAPLSTMYDLDNFDASGYYEGVWTGNAQSVTFKTKEITYETYDEDEDGNEYITGYTTTVTGARVKKIYVTLDRIPDGIESIATDTKNSEAFDLAGRRVNVAAQKGVMIVDGKKVIR